MWILRRRVERVGLLGGVVVADGRPRLHGGRRKPVVLEPQLHNVLGLGEGGIGRLLVAEHQPEADIALRAILPNLGCPIFGGVFEIDHRRDRLVVHLDHLGGIARLAQRLRDDERDAVADEAHLVGNEHRLEGTVTLRRAEIFGHQMRG